MPTILFHLTIVIMLATSLHLILSIIKIVKVSEEKELKKFSQITKENQKSMTIKIFEVNQRKVLCQQFENIQLNVNQIKLQINKLNEEIEKISSDNQKLLKQYFRPHQWSKSNKG